TVPGRLPGVAGLLGRVLRGASHVIAAGGYPASEARRAAGCDLPLTVVPPGVDVERFVPLEAARRGVERERFGLAADGLLVVGVRPERAGRLSAALGRLLDDQPVRAQLGPAGRARAEGAFSYDVLARRLHAALGAPAPSCPRGRASSRCRGRARPCSRSPRRS